MIKEIFTTEKFTEIINSEQFNTVKNIHLVEKRINEIEGSKSSFTVNLAKNCFEQVKSYFDVEYTHDIEIIEKFIKSNSDFKDLVTVFKSYESHHLRKPDQIGPYIIELTETEAIDRENVFSYQGQMLPAFKETGMGFFRGKESIFRGKINYIESPPKREGGLTHLEGIFIKPNPKFIEKSRGNFLKMIYEVMNEPYIKVKSDYDLFKEKESYFYNNFVGPKKPHFLFEKEESEQSRDYIQKHILRELSALLLINQNDEFISDYLSKNFNIKNSWVRFFSLCSSLLIEKKYQEFVLSLSNDIGHNLDAITERNRLRGYRDFNFYEKNQYSHHVQIPEVLKIVLINAYSEFYKHLNTHIPSNDSLKSEPITHQLEALVRLKEANHISEDEFLLAKKKILGI